MKLDDALQAAMGRGPQASAGVGMSGTDASAWQREMERAQVHTWFHGWGGDAARSQVQPPTGPAPRREAPLAPLKAAAHGGAVVSGGRAGAGVAVAASLPGWGTGSLGGSSPTTQGQLAIQVTPVQRDVREGSTMPLATARVDALGRVTARVDALAVTGPEPASTGPDRASRQAASNASESSPMPVRVHIEGDAEQATVWLGMNAQSVVHLPQLTQAIGRWLARTGYREARWVCNGQPVDPSRAPVAPIRVQSQGETP